MIGYLSKVLRTVVWTCTLGDSWWARRIALAGVRLYKSEFQLDENGGLRLAGGTLILPRTDRAASLLRHHGDLAALSKAGACYRADEPWDTISIDGVSLCLFNGQRVVIAKEVFVDHVYSFSSNRPSVVLDVGMNVATASLYLAKTTGSLILGYEPFTQTYRQALKNISLNPSLQANIVPSNVAWGSSDRQVPAEYCPGAPFVCGFFEVPQSYRDGRGICEELINVRAARDMVSDIFRSHPESQIVLKLDREGAEYEIIQSLHESAVLGRIQVIILEWHRRARDDMPSKLRDLLTESGFIVLGNGASGENTGLMRAVRNPSDAR